jgi:putative endonuclease
MIHGGYIYVMTNSSNHVFYTGVTADLYSRVTEHKEIIHPYSFTAKYQTFKLVYYEGYHSIEEAIAREKQFKRYAREKKISLIKRLNSEFKDLYDVVKYW